MTLVSPTDRAAVGLPVSSPTPDFTPTDDMTEAARVAIAARLPAYEQLPRHEQFRIAHMALAAGLSESRAWWISRVLPVLMLLFLVTACGRKPTAPVERVCWVEEWKVPILNPAGDTVAFNTFRARRCSGS